MVIFNHLFFVFFFVLSAIFQLLLIPKFLNKSWISQSTDNKLPGESVLKFSFDFELQSSKVSHLLNCKTIDCGAIFFVFFTFFGNFLYTKLFLKFGETHFFEAIVAEPPSLIWLNHPLTKTFLPIIDFLGHIVVIYESEYNRPGKSFPRVPLDVEH